MFGVLYLQSAYNLLKNTIPMDTLMKHAKAGSYDFVALTDENLYGLISFFKHAKAYHLKPILGLKVNVSFEFGDTGFLIYVKNQRGYQNLLRLNLIKEEKGLSIDDLINHQEGLIFVSSGEDSIIDLKLLEDNIDLALSYTKVFHKQLNDFYLGLSLQSFDHEFKIAPKLFELSEKLNIKCLPIHRTCYLEKEDQVVYEALIKIDQEQHEIPKDTSYAFKNKNELTDMFLDYSYVFENLREVVKDIVFELTFPEFQMPVFQSPKGNPEAYLKSLAILGLKKRLSSKIDIDEKAYQSRLLYELSIIHKMGYDSYFLIVYDFVKYAKTNGILVGPGRGSAAGSLVAYCLGITDVDPMTYDLLFERFLNPERITMPDIDLDFPDDRRDEVLQYVKSKYGEFHTVSIVTFGTFALKSSIRDIARVMKIDNTRVTGIIQNVIKNKIDQTDYELTRLIEVAKKIEGLPRHTGTHAAGIILAHQDLRDVIPLQLGPSGFYQSQLEQTDLEALGLLKIDFLGIRNLATIDQTVKSIQETNPQFQLQHIDLEDEKTYMLLSKGETSGIFQLESLGMRSVLRKLKPKCFEDIVAINALFRPGPMDHIDEYIARKNGKSYAFIDPNLKPILSSTYGIIVYQEQIMRIAHEFAGYSLAEADLLRRAISKKDKETMDLERKRFIEKCHQKQYDEHVAIEIYDLIVRFADYGFNRSHSVAYGLIAYQMAYLKANHYKDFISVLLSSVIGNESLTLEYITEAQKNQIAIKPPHINISEDRYIKMHDMIYMPFLSIKSIGKTVSQKIIDERNHQGPFLDFQNLKTRLKSEINDKNLEMLIHSGALDTLDMNHQTMMHHKNLNDAGYELYITDFVVNKMEEYDMKRLIEFEKEALGFNLSYHPLILYQDIVKDKKLDQLSDLNSKQEITALAYIKKIKTIQTKQKKSMAFILLDDGVTSLEVTCFSNEYLKFENKLDDRAKIFKIRTQAFQDKSTYVLVDIQTL